MNSLAAVTLEDVLPQRRFTESRATLISKILGKKKKTRILTPNPWLGKHPKSAKIYLTCSKNVPQLLDFDGIGTVANAKHPRLGYLQGTCS